uniref:Transposase n=1 Tax=Steinernema glaseri TaxID=37863 RepID=A0A1I7ZUE0_9BILA
MNTKDRSIPWLDPMAGLFLRTPKDALLALMENRCPRTLLESQWLRMERLFLRIPEEMWSTIPRRSRR